MRRSSPYALPEPNIDSSAIDGGTFPGSVTGHPAGADADAPDADGTGTGDEGTGDEGTGEAGAGDGPAAEFVAVQPTASSAIPVRAADVIALPMPVIPVLPACQAIGSRSWSTIAPGSRRTTGW
ncbi:hypothetical protein J5X84_28795 [Streptosporangiaceae bacterium NEAU-GS5]|nr:hypothetical protein [Streptosporangiaceae bacterium NEAU-GS5]